MLAGTDEAGRGCLAGPVVAAAVVLPPGWAPEALDDSKRLTARRREALYRDIVREALDWQAEAAWPREIEHTDILRSSLRAMATAVARLRVRPDLVLVDGNQAPPLDCPADCLVGGDGLSAAVAAASIVAKVVRDGLMIDLDVRHPGYGFAGHKGYGAASHLAALQRLGPCPLHRRTFAPVALLRQGSLW
ncbi:MAG: ribonuclease HII [Gemmatimonas sp.]|nr:ribonuclease HII [Gemmatimonas sp.]